MIVIRIAITPSLKASRPLRHGGSQVAGGLYRHGRKRTVAGVPPQSSPAESLMSPGHLTRMIALVLLAAAGYECLGDRSAGREPGPASRRVGWMGRDRTGGYFS